MPLKRCSEWYCNVCRVLNITLRCTSQCYIKVYSLNELGVDFQMFLKTPVNFNSTINKPNKQYATNNESQVFTPFRISYTCHSRVCLVC